MKIRIKLKIALNLAKIPFLLYNFSKKDRIIFWIMPCYCFCVHKIADRNGCAQPKLTMQQPTKKQSCLLNSSLKKSAVLVAVFQLQRCSLNCISEMLREAVFHMQIFLPVRVSFLLIEFCSFFAI